MSELPVFKSQGDTSLLAYLGWEIDPVINARTRALAQALSDDPAPGVREVAASYACLQLCLDPVATDQEQLKQWVREAHAKLPAKIEETGRLVEIPTMYGGGAGPDLEEVAQRCGLSSDEVIRRHSSRDYPCYLVGFTPGFPYLGGGDPELSLPRLDSPRLQVPVGSVAIAYTQTGVYSLGGPGGWHLLGRTPQSIYDPGRQPPNLINAGDVVRFVPIKQAEFTESAPADPAEGWQGQALFKVKHPGAYTTVQDGGRWGFQNIGVPLSGALDQYSLAAANALLGNPPEAAALELTVLGPKLEALAAGVIAVCGADLGFMLNGKPAPQNQAVELAAGDLISFGGPRGGVRAVLAVAGGLGAPLIMGSRSAYPLGRISGPLKPGMTLTALPSTGPPAGGALPEALAPRTAAELTLRVVTGPNDDHFPDQALDEFYSAQFTISQDSDRRGLRLSGPALQFQPGRETSILSEPQVPGVIQVPSGGSPIILLNEQSVGGYCKIGCVISADLDGLARIMPGGKLRFKKVSLAEAKQAAKERQGRLDQLAPMGQGG
jgi:KipI family sensor histidine kinase inhibitor